MLHNIDTHAVCETNLNEVVEDNFGILRADIERSVAKDNEAFYQGVDSHPSLIGDNMRLPMQNRRY